MTVAKQSSIIDKMKKDSEQLQYKPKSPSVLRKASKIGKENLQTIISPLRERNHWQELEPTSLYFCDLIIWRIVISIKFELFLRLLYLFKKKFSLWKQCWKLHEKPKNGNLFIILIRLFYLFIFKFFDSICLIFCWRPHRAWQRDIHFTCYFLKLLNTLGPYYNHVKFYYLVCHVSLSLLLVLSKADTSTIYYSV